MTLEEYHEALSKGTHNGGVAAIFDEIPYIKLYLAKFCSTYTMVAPTYKIDGFGFVSLSLSQQNKKQKQKKIHLYHSFRVMILSHSLFYFHF